MNQTVRTMKTSTLLKRFIPYYRKYIAVLLFDLFCAALTTLCDIALPLIVRSITQLATTDIAALTVAYILRLGMIYLVLRVVDALANFYMAARGHIMGTWIERDMRYDLFAHLQSLGFAYYSSAKVGQIMSRITNDLFEVTEFAHHCPEEFFIAGIKITVSFIILVGVNPVLTLIIFAVLPAMLFSTRYFNRKMRQAFQERRFQLGEINAQVEDSLLGIRVVKSFANEPMEIEKFQRGNDAFVTIKRKAYLYMAGFATTTRVFDGLMYIVVVVAGGLFLIRGWQVPRRITIAYLRMVGICP